jgi:hypothetical protein
MIAQADHRARRAAIKWLLFVVFAHTLPSFWFIAVAAGFSPAATMLVAGLSGGLYLDLDSERMALSSCCRAWFIAWSILSSPGPPPRRWLASPVRGCARC